MKQNVIKLFGTKNKNLNHKKCLWTVTIILDNIRKTAASACVGPCTAIFDDARKRIFRESVKMKNIKPNWNPNFVIRRVKTSSLVFSSFARLCITWERQVSFTSRASPSVSLANRGMGELCIMGSVSLVQGEQDRLQPDARTAGDN